jgi:hypothetical protein
MITHEPLCGHLQYFTLLSKERVQGTALANSTHSHIMLPPLTLKHETLATKAHVKRTGHNHTSPQKASIARATLKQVVLAS